MDATRSSPPEYLTRDLQASAFLKARGHRLLRVDRSRTPRLLVFAWTPRIEQDVRDYFADQPVGAQTLFDSYRALKRAIFEPV